MSMIEKLLLILIVWIIFTVGCHTAKRLDDFIKANNQRLLSESSSIVRISAETPDLLKTSSSLLEYYSNINPYMNFYFDSKNLVSLLRDINNGSTDIGILSKEHIHQLNPHHLGYFSISCHLLEQETTSFLIIWNKRLPSRNRNRVLSFLENQNMFSTKL